jgi:hypothetical protein
MDESTRQRFMAKVTVLPNGCWVFSGKKGDGGYTYFWFEGKSRLAHRFIYEQMVGPIPDGYQVDHLCHARDSSCPANRDCPHRACVNPAHLEPVPPVVNVLRSTGLAAKNAVKTVCANGHSLTKGNTYVYPSGERGCRACRVEANRRFRDARHPVRKPAAANRTHCPQGHPYDEANTRVNNQGKRVCITCFREQDRERKRILREQANPSTGERALTLPQLYNTHCKYGHEWTPENTVFAGTRRSCRQCRADRDAAGSA